MPSKAKEISAPEFEKEVLKSDLPVLVDFWAPWCRPCQMMAPILDEISGELAGKAKIAKVDVEDRANGALAMQYEIRSIPNMKLFKGGQVVHEFIGLRPKEALLSELEPFIQK
ncbi:MAG: thioredoxin [Patescibacteria group bacterium]|nr:thioredoxin [Patescibacteria group bacterium]MDE1940963.1 thioredoxin [Patescibacteria group bacterium]MDE1967214.1 thioredoxin [Patescibacteria group bacterium]